MRVAFLGDQFQDGLVVQRRLLGFAEPGGAQGLQARQVVCGHGIDGMRRVSQEQPLFGDRVQFARSGQMFLLLKRAQGGAGLRADATVE